MFMGVGPELHGYTQWGSKIPDLPSRELNKNGIFLMGELIKGMGEKLCLKWEHLLLFQDKTLLHLSLTLYHSPISVILLETIT